MYAIEMFISQIVFVMTPKHLMLVNLIVFVMQANLLMMILENGNDSKWSCNQSWESYCSLVYFDLKILLFLVNTLITKFDDVISN